MPIPSHLNHSRAPNTKPEPSDSLASQQCTPEHSDSLASSQRIPDPTHLQPFLSLVSSRFPTHTHSRPDAPPTSPLPHVKSIPDKHTHSRPDAFRPSLLCVKLTPDVLLFSRLWSGEARSRTSLARCVLACPFSLPIYMFPLRSSVTSLATLRSFSMSHPQFPVSVYPCFIYLYSLPPSTVTTMTSHPVLCTPSRVYTQFCSP